MILDTDFIQTFLLSKTSAAVQLLVHKDFNVLCAGVQVYVPDTENSNPKTEYFLLNPITSYCILH